MVNSFVIGGFLGGPVNSTGSVITQFKTSQNKDNLIRICCSRGLEEMKFKAKLIMQIVNARNDLSRSATTKKKKTSF